VDELFVFDIGKEVGEDTGGMNDNLSEADGVGKE
jgi:hypothetical protein